MGVRFDPARPHARAGYPDEVRLVHVTLEEGGPEFGAAAAEMAARLGLEGGAGGRPPRIAASERRKKVG